MDVLISSKAEKQFMSLPSEIQISIRELFTLLQEEGLTANLDIKKLKGYPNYYRIRIGDYRIRMEFEKPDKLLIYWIGKRSKAYRH
ncbi:MAG: type II toxin-antitoxin system RelE family toxin [Candidatus Hodarchaeales archaeon]